MKAKFTKSSHKDEILIIAETEKEGRDLCRWESCICSAEFKPHTNRDAATPALLIVKEV